MNARDDHVAVSSMAAVYSSTPVASPSIPAVGQFAVPVGRPCPFRRRPAGGPRE
ncbi:hypothetical protein [Natrinema sp. DC36]|uniref:hypothetical protein n=1 Tax=Natrinema sp. DC36 TaxID=2878680 RepID=UPI001CF04418|nr:hypothetical protein [Natrinema sp. DC36]